jgi:dipeptidyl aminopeptidase/acylaminoacyl peptidase
LVFDRFTRTLLGIRYRSSRPTTSWLRAEWADVQTQLEASLPGRSVEIQQWDDAANRFLVLLRSPADPGSFCVFDRAAGKLSQFAPRLPGRSAKSVPTTLEFGFIGPEDVPVTGLVTVPVAPRLKPIPMVVLCPPFPWERAPWDYNAAVEAFAEMGLVVVQFQGRGAWGAGIKRREAIKSGYEEAQLADVIAVIDHLTKLYHVNPKRVALYGQQHGGFVALRGLHLHPDRFRCAVAVNAPVDLAAWQNELRWNDEAFGPLLVGAYLGDAPRLRAAPLVRNAAKIARPALLLHYRGVPGQAASTSFLAAKRFAADVRTEDAPTTFWEVERDFMESRPAAKARAFAQIAEFFNLTIYDYVVEVGPEKVVEP